MRGQGRVRGLRPAVSLLAATVALTAAGSASASYDPVGSGTARITLDGGFAKTLKKNGIVLSGRKGAKVTGKKITLTADTGKADPTIRKSDVDYRGELFFVRGKQNVNVRAIALKTKPTPLFAKVSGGQLKVVKADRVELKRSGFGTELVATKLKLTEKAAVRLDKKLGVDAFSEGTPFGKLSAVSEPQTVAILPAGTVTLDIDPNLYARLNANSVSVNPLFPAEHVGPRFTFPIVAGGQLAPDGSAGTLRLGGAMELLHLGAGQLFWKEPWLDFAGPFVTSEESLLQPSKPTQDLGRTPFLDLAIPAAAFATNPSSRTIAVSGATLALPAATAALFNEGLAEGRQEFHGGEPFATLTLAAQSQ